MKLFSDLQFFFVVFQNFTKIQTFWRQLYLSFFLAVYLTILLSLIVSIFPPICLSVNLSIYLSIYDLCILVLVLDLLPNEKLALNFHSLIHLLV